MNLDWKKIGIALGIIAAIILLVSLGLYLHNKKNSTPASSLGGVSGLGSNSSLPSVSVSTSAGGLLPSSGTSTTTLPKIFEISRGPVIAATLITMQNPTTTLARYVTAQDGHVLDLPLDVPGAQPRLASNTTIPGVENAVWTNKGGGVVFQYLSRGVIKSVHLSLPAASTTASDANAIERVSLRQLPDDVISIASSPDGESLSYLLRSPAGSDGYISSSDGSNAKKLFSVPLSQIILSWPSQGTLLLYSKSDAGVPGIAFSVNVKTGAVAPILYGLGLTVSGNSAFSYLLYQTADRKNATLFLQKVGGSSIATRWGGYGTPAPEKCLWSLQLFTVALCAAPAQQTAGEYLDSWHRGQTEVADVLIGIDASTDQTGIVATPGGSDGGEPSDIIGLSLSSDSRYLSFVAKNDASLWGVRLGQ